MAVNQKPTGRTMSIPGGLAFGGLCSLAVTLTLAGALAWFVAEEKMPQKNIGYGIMVLLLASSFAGAMASWAKVRRQRALVCMLSGVIYFVMLLAMTALFFGGQYSGVGATGLLVFCGSALAILTGLRQGRGAKHRKLKMPHC